MWIFKANKVCSHVSHGPDTSQTPVVKLGGEWSKWVRGGKDQLEICRNVRDGYNARALSSGAIAELNQPTPVEEQKQKDQFGQVTYAYKCELKISTYPGKVAASPACGQEEKWSYQIQGQAPAGANCLSCDNLQSSIPEVMVNCLKKNISEVILPKAIDLRDSDVTAVKAQVKRLLKINKDYRPIANLQSSQELNFFIDFVEQN